MKVFFHKYGYNIVKMFLYQFAVSLFGSTLAMATTSSGNRTLTIVVSICAVLFYLFLLYVMTWEIGAQDKIAVDVGKKEYRPFTGFVMSAIANIINFVIAIVFTVGYPSMMAGEEWGSNICAVVKVLLFLLEGMYLGVATAIKIDVAGISQALNNLWWPYFLMPLPAILTCGIAYYLGHKNIHFTSVVLYQEPNKKKK